MASLVEREALLLQLLLIFGVCRCYVYKIGDSPGWTIIGNVDYRTWASSKTFHVGDTLIFEYDRRYHNVLQVSRSGYHSCNTSAPIAAYATGNDSIIIHGAGHYYYICGFVGHCQAGQKVDVRVPKGGEQASGGPIGSEGRSPPEPPASPVVPSPSPSKAQSMRREYKLNEGGLMVLVIWMEWHRRRV